MHSCLSRHQGSSGLTSTNALKGGSQSLIKQLLQSASLLLVTSSTHAQAWVLAPRALLRSGRRRSAASKRRRPQARTRITSRPSATALRALTKWRRRCGTRAWRPPTSSWPWTSLSPTNGPASSPSAVRTPRPCYDKAQKPVCGRNGKRVRPARTRCRCAHVGAFVHKLRVRPRTPDTSGHTRLSLFSTVWICAQVAHTVREHTCAPGDMRCRLQGAAYTTLRRRTA